MARLTRDRDGEGHYGCVLDALDLDGTTPGGKIVGHEPMIGYCFKISTMTAGMFSTRDWWMTTPVTEIISSTEDMVIFKTGNSTYTLQR